MPDVLLDAGATGLGQRESGRLGVTKGRRQITYNTEGQHTDTGFLRELGGHTGSCEAEE